MVLCWPVWRLWLICYGWVRGDRFQNSIHGFTPAPSFFAHQFPLLLPRGLYLHRKLREQIFSQQGFSDAIMLISSDLCFTQSFCGLTGSRYVLSPASEDPIKDSLYHVSSQLPMTSACHFLGRHRERVVIFTSLVILRGSLPFNYSWVSEEEREHWRGIICRGTSKVITCSSHQSCKENSPNSLDNPIFPLRRETDLLPKEPPN